MSRGLAFAAPRYPRFRRMHCIGNGQSLSVGSLMPTPIDTTQIYNNAKLFDSSGTYDITKPTASTLSRVPLVALMRPVTTITSYPANIAGESIEIPFCNEVTRLARLAGFPFFDWDASCVGIGGAAFSEIGPGGTGNAYAAGVFETQAFANLSGKNSFGVAAYFFTHGEADAIAQTPIAQYLSDLQFLRSRATSDSAAVTGQIDQVPLILTQQASSPESFAGIDTTSQAMFLAAQADPFTILGGPKYQYHYANDNTHLFDYRPPAEKCAQAYVAWYLKQYYGIGPGWAPLWPTSATRNGLTVTVTYNVPFGPLLFDPTITGPHQAGQPFSMWAGGNGFEFWDDELVVSTTSGNGVSPISVTFTTPHGRQTGDTLAIFGIFQNTNANGVFTVTVTGANTVTLNGTTGNGAYTSGGVAMCPIGITGTATVSGNAVSFPIARAPVGGGKVGYAMRSDAAYGSFTGGMISSAGNRFGTLRDSDLYVGPSGYSNPNWGCHFELAVA